MTTKDRFIVDWRGRVGDDYKVIDTKLDRVVKSFDSYRTYPNAGTARQAAMMEAEALNESFRKAQEADKQLDAFREGQP